MAPAGFAEGGTMRNKPTKLLPMLIVGIALQVLPAAAGSCSWSAKMEEDEGGSVLTASVCGGAKQDSHLMLTCVGQPTLSYDLGATGEELEPGISASFDFSAGGETATKKLDLEAMYNYFVARLKPSDPLLALLQGKGDVTVSSSKYGQNSFPLTGSSKAIRKVLASCKASAG
jgi:hypothetical protein